MYPISTHVVVFLICSVAQLICLCTAHNTTGLTLAQHHTLRKFAFTLKYRQIKQLKINPKTIPLLHYNDPQFLKCPVKSNIYKKQIQSLMFLIEVYLKCSNGIPVKFPAVHKPSPRTAVLYCRLYTRI
jgi:hypothetical protein